MAKHQPIAIRLEVDITEIDDFAKELAARFARIRPYVDDELEGIFELDELHVWLVDYFRSHLVAGNTRKTTH